MAWNKSTSNTVDATSSSRPTGRGKMPRLRKGLLAGMIVVLGAGIATWLLTNGEATSSSLQKKDRGLIKEVAPAAAPIYKDEPKKAEEPQYDPVKKAKIAKMKKMTPEERIDFIFEEMKNRPIDLTPTTNRPFRTGTELQMARIFTKELGDMPPPLMPTPLKDEAHLAEILIADNPIIEGDSESVRRAKEVVEVAKRELKAYIKEGGNVTDFLQYYHAKLVDAHQERMTCQRSVNEILRNDPDIAVEYVNEVNKRLESKGIKPVTIPPKARKRIGLED